MNTINLGEPLCEYTLSITGLTEYGVSFEDLVSGKIPPPPEGARFDVAFSGEAIGSKRQGKFRELTTHTFVQTVVFNWMCIQK